MVVLVSLVVSKASAQSPQAAAASEAFNKRDWAGAADAYTTLLKSDTSIAGNYVRLAIALTELGRYEDARQQLAIAERRGAAAPQVAFRRALIAAGENRLDSAFAQLKVATDAGMGAVPVPGDSLRSMSKIKADSRFAAFTENLDRNARPCMYNDKHKEFDFWLGTWDVRPRGVTGGPASRNVITKVENGCVVLETYSTPGPFTGQSYNIWDSTRQKWFQYWVDNTGGLHEYSGNFIDGAMRYEGSVPNGPRTAGRATFRVTFYPMPPDSMRQHGEALGSDGKWTTSYDLIYTKVK
jgi:hypothetical protein